MQPNSYRAIAYINRKDWWHVVPRDPGAYAKRGKFLSPTFHKAEFWGRPLDQPQRVAIMNPLIGDEEYIEKRLFGRRVSTPNITTRDRWKLDARMKRSAAALGYDSIVLFSGEGFLNFRLSGKTPRSIELNILNP